MGTVYEALDQRVNAVVALKEANPAADDESRREFESEAALLANLHHEALPRVMDYFIEGGAEFLVMEYIPGYDLLELLSRRGSSFHVDLVLRWADDVLELLEYLHQRQPPILHRDIKPANLKLTQQEKLFLLDFGLAKGATGQMATLLTSRSVRGYTPVYAPVEQILSLGTDQRSDLYSLGATLYHLLTNVPPADAPARYQDTEDRKPDPLLPISQLNPQVPRGVADVLHRALALSRRDRPESAAVMRQELREAVELAKGTVGLDHQMRVSQPAGRERARVHPGLANPIVSQPIVPVVRRKKGLVILIAAVILAAAAIFAIVVMTRRTGTVDQTTLSAKVTPLPSATPAERYSESVAGVPLEMVLIPGGTFTMGASGRERVISEGPPHQVSVRPFYIGKYEVTQSQWRAVTGTNPSEFRADDRPVDRISWNDAVEFCRRLSRMTGREYRLPSEAEWEYACRGGTTTTFAFGNSLSSAQANFDGNSPYGDAPKDVYRQETTRVGTFKPNAFGLYDMHGNIWEWCQDPYHETYEGAPTDGSVWSGDSEYRLMRGGGWLSSGYKLRCAARDKLRRDDTFVAAGFRVAVSPP